MTDRDQMALDIVRVLIPLAKGALHEYPERVIPRIAATAFRIADAMIAESERRRQ